MKCRATQSLVQQIQQIKQSRSNAGYMLNTGNMLHSYNLHSSLSVMLYSQTL